MPVNSLQMQCSKCRVADTCPRKGSSPLKVPNSRLPVFCQLVGGYGRTPVDRTLLSKESLEIAEKNGPCVTIAEVPRYDEDSGHVVHDVVTIFSPPVLHPREKVAWDFRSVFPGNPSGK